MNRQTGKVSEFHELQKISCSSQPVVASRNSPAFNPRTGHVFPPFVLCGLERGAFWFDGANDSRR